LNPAGAEVINDSNNTVVSLPFERLVSKVSTSALEARGREALERELGIGRHVAPHGAAIAPPAFGDTAGPHRSDGMVLTLWRFQEEHPKPVNGDRSLARALHGFHTALHDMVGTLPPLVEKIDRAAALYRAADATSQLSTLDRRLAERAYLRLREFFRGLDASTALHGEPHEGNIIWTKHGPVLIDFEATCAGPLEWDLAYLPPAAVAEFRDRDDNVVAKLRPAVSFCVAAWCLAQPTRAPEVARAATYHFRELRHSWLARRRDPGCRS